MIELTLPAMRAMFPRAPDSVLQAFVNKQGVLSKEGINHTRTRLAIFFANIEHECDGFTIPNLTENTNYSAERMAQVWSNRFASANAVRAKYGTAPGWQKKALDDIYGSRMGNRPGTSDGSTYIGRGGPQWTGRDGYRACGERVGRDAVTNPTIVSRFDLQPEICAAFWAWKKLNALADTGNVTAVRKVWNGGSNGLADVNARLKGNDPTIKALQNVEALKPIVKDLPGQPPTATPPKEVVDATTEKERKTRKAGGAGAVVGGGNEAAKGAQSQTVQPDKQVPLLPTPLAAGLLVVGLVVIVIATVLIARKRSAVIANWF